MKNITGKLLPAFCQFMDHKYRKSKTILVHFLFRLDLFNCTLISGEEPGFAAAAVGTGAAVLDGGVGFFAGTAVGDSGESFEDQFAAGEKGAFFSAHVIPAVEDLFVDDSGDLPDFQSNRTDAGQLIVCRHIGQGLDHMSYNSKFMHNN